MKTIGLIGGMSWESSMEYYRILNEQVKQRLGGLHSAKILMYSVDFAEIEKMQHQGNWHEATALMIDAAQRVEKGGADTVLICTNTMHKMADEVQKHISLPLLHIADATAERIKKQGIQKVGLLGTRFTMEESFYKGRLADIHGLEVMIPSDHERQLVHEIIYKELCLGLIHQSSKEYYTSVVQELVARGAEAVILGCTEITLLLQQGDVETLLFDTTRIHAESAVDYALQP